MGAFEYRHLYPKYRIALLEDSTRLELPDTLVRTAFALHRHSCLFTVSDGGKGRTGLVATCLLMALDVPQNDALDCVQNVKQGMLQNPVQIIYVKSFLKYAPEFDSQSI